jgi:alcohol dehydrogenase (NADP+)
MYTLTNIPYSQQANIQEVLPLLRKNGVFVQVGNPDDGAFSIHPGPLMGSRLSFTGSSTGSPDEIREMFQLAADKGVKSWIEERPMAEANQALIDLAAGKPRYRYVLVNP